MLAPFAGSMASAAVPPSDQERPENNGSPNAQLLAPIYELDSKGRLGLQQSLPVNDSDAPKPDDQPAFTFSPENKKK